MSGFDFVGLSETAKGTLDLFVRGAWTREVELALSQGDWERLTLCLPEFEDYTRLLPYKEKIRWLNVRIYSSPKSRDGLDQLEFLERLELYDGSSVPIDFRKLPRLRRLFFPWVTGMKPEYLACGELRHLSIHGLKETSLDKFPLIPKLEVLHLDKGSLASLRGIERMVGLVELKLARLGRLKELDGVDALSGLEVVHAEGVRQLQDIRPLLASPRLKRVDISGVKASLDDIGWINDKPELTELQLSTPVDRVDWDAIAAHPALVSVGFDLVRDCSDSDEVIRQKLAARGKVIESFQPFDRKAGRAYVFKLAHGGYPEKATELQPQPPSAGHGATIKFRARADALEHISPPKSIDRIGPPSLGSPGSERTASGSPEQILGDVPWSFTGSPLDSREAFVEAVREEHAELAELGESVDWFPDEVVLAVARVRIRHRYGLHPDAPEPEVALEADNGQSFSAGELLHKVHNAFVDELADQDHHFFEGLRLLEPDDGTGAPVYELEVGS